MLRLHLLEEPGLHLFRQGWLKPLLLQHPNQQPMWWLGKPLLLLEELLSQHPNHHMMLGQHLFHQ